MADTTTDIIVATIGDEICKFLWNLQLDKRKVDIAFQKRDSSAHFPEIFTEYVFLENLTWKDIQQYERDNSIFIVAKKEPKDIHSKNGWLSIIQRVPKKKILNSIRAQITRIVISNQFSLEKHLELDPTEELKLLYRVVRRKYSLEKLNDILPCQTLKNLLKTLE
jgi:hypothetical protein